jgi:hypothetical protein
MSTMQPHPTSAIRPVNPADFDDPRDYLAHCAALCAEIARHAPGQDGPAPAEQDDTIDVSGADLDWWGELTARSEWWYDLGRDDVADSYGDDADDHDAWESGSVAEYLRRREAEGAADELARWGGFPT